MNTENVTVTFQDAFDALDRLRYKTSEYDVDLVRRYIVKATSDAVGQVRGLTHDEVEKACRNVGINLGCDACAAVFYTGSSLVEKHSCSAETSNAANKKDRVQFAELMYLRTAVLGLLRVTELATRWPCPDCGRKSEAAPLCGIWIEQEKGARAYSGCWLCNTEAYRKALKEALEDV